MITLSQKCKILLASLAVIFNFQICSFIMNRTLTGDEPRVRNFYKLEKDSLDIVLLGASTAYTDYSAPLAWKEYGITSYSLGTNSAPMGLAKSMLKEVRNYQNPKLILIDINGILYDDDGETKEASIRRWIDNMRFSSNKVDTIQEMIPESQRIYYYLPLLKYHSNWEHLDECLKAAKIQLATATDPTYLSAMCMEGSTSIKPMKNLIDVKNYKKTSPMFKKSGQHLIELLEYCKQENITNVIFTNMPRFYNSDKMLKEKERFNEAKKTITSYGYTCIDLDEDVDEIGLDPQTDFYNPNHLNVYGQKKNTKYLVERLMKDYGIKGNHDAEIKARWDKEYQAYQAVYEWADNKIKEGDDRFYAFFKVYDVIQDMNNKETK